MHLVCGTFISKLGLTKTAPAVLLRVLLQSPSAFGTTYKAIQRPGALPCEAQALMDFAWTPKVIV